MSTRAGIHYDRGLLFLSAGLMLAVGLGAVLYFGYDLDLLAFSGWGAPCPFHAITGLACPGCGMTRALVLVNQLQWWPALRMNPFVFALLGFAAMTLGERIFACASFPGKGIAIGEQPRGAPRVEKHDRSPVCAGHSIEFAAANE